MRTFEHYEDEISKCIQEYKIYTIEMIFTFYPGISRSQFYLLDLNKSDILKRELDNNKNRTKHSQLKKWADSDNATLQIALYKTICSDDDRKKLSQTYTDLTTDGDKVGMVVNIVNPNT
jgi:hypothetical protein